MTITRSGIAIVRDRRNCLKGLEGLNFFRTVRTIKTIETITRSSITVLSGAIVIVLKVSIVFFIVRKG